MAKLLETYIKGDAKIVDLGCGIGLSLHVTAQIFPNIMGYEIERRTIESCKEILKEVGKGNTPLKLYDGKKLPFSDHSLDAVLSIEVVEHTNKPGLMLKEIKRVLKKDGVLIVTTPNKYWFLETHYRLPFLAFVPQKIADYYVRFSGKGEKYDIYPRSYAQFYQMVNKYFEIKDVTFDTVLDYKKFNLDKERGKGIKYVAWLIKWLRILKLNKVENILSYFSEGWVFVGKPKK